MTWRGTFRRCAAEEKTCIFGFLKRSAVHAEFNIEKLPRWPWFVLSLLLFAGAAALYNSLATPVYHTTTRVRINEYYISGTPGGGYTLRFDATNWYNLTAIMQSYGNVEAVLELMEADINYYRLDRVAGITRRTDLWHDSPLRLHQRTGRKLPGNERLRVTILNDSLYRIAPLRRNILFTPDNPELAFGESLTFNTWYSIGNRPFMLELLPEKHKAERRHERHEVHIRDMDALVKDYRSRIHIESIGVGFAIVDFDFRDCHPGRATEFMEYLTHYFFVQQQEELDGIALQQLDFFDRQIARHEEVLEEGMRELQRLREEAGFLDLRQSAYALLFEEYYLRQDLSRAMLLRSYHDFLLEALQAGEAGGEVFGVRAPGLYDAELNAMLNALSRLYRERSLLLLSTSAGSPAVRKLDTEIRSLRTAAKENLRTRKAANELALARLEEALAATRDELSGLLGSQQQLHHLERELRVAQSLQNKLRNNQWRARQAFGLGQAGNYLLEPVRLVRQQWPKPWLSYGAALVLALLLPVALHFAHDQLKVHIRDADDLERLSGVPLIGQIPAMKAGRETRHQMPAVLQPGHPEVLEGFRKLRGMTRFYGSESRQKVIMVSSTTANEGKTFVALNLATALAMNGHKTLFIDADMRKNSLNTQRRVYRDRGLSNYLIGQLSLEDVLRQNPHHENLFMITAGSRPPNLPELLDSSAMSALLSNPHDFDCVVMDTPPIGLVADAQGMIDKAHLFLYVVCRGQSRFGDIPFIKEMYHRSGEKRMALVFNKAGGASLLRASR